MQTRPFNWLEKHDSLHTQMLRYTFKTLCSVVDTRENEAGCLILSSEVSEEVRLSKLVLACCPKGADV